MFSWFYTREVWYILRGSSNDYPPDRNRPDYVKLSCRSRVSDFEIAVKARPPHRLASVDADELMVSARETCHIQGNAVVDRRLPVKLSDELEDL